MVQMIVFRLFFFFNVHNYVDVRLLLSCIMSSGCNETNPLGLARSIIRSMRLNCSCFKQTNIGKKKGSQAMIVFDAVVFSDTDKCESLELLKVCHELSG